MRLKKFLASALAVLMIFSSFGFMPQLKALAETSLTNNENGLVTGTAAMEAATGSAIDASTGGAIEVSTGGAIDVNINSTSPFKLTEAELAASKVDWFGSAKATVYVKITSGDSSSALNGAIQLGEKGTDGKPVGKSSSKWLAGSTSGKSGNAIQDNIIGKAGSGIYKFPDINLNTVLASDGYTKLTDEQKKYFTLTITSLTANTNAEFLGMRFTNGAVYPTGFKVPTNCESTSFDPVINYKNNLKLSLDYCATMDSSKYTEASWTIFQAALESAKAIYDKAGATDAEYKAARATLEDAKTDMQFVSSTDPGNPMAFRVVDGEQTIHEMGAGVNLGNTLDGHSGFTPSETAWQNVVTTKKYIKALHDAGFNTVRIPVTWGTMIDTKNGYSLNPLWVSRVQDIVDYCVSQDMYAIINVHHDGAEQSGWLRVAADNIDNVYEEYEYVWRNIANIFKNYDEHLIFESMNEITCMEGDNKNSADAVAQDTPVIMNLNQIFVNVVRSTGSNNTKRWLAFVSHYANGGTQSGFDKPTDSYNSENRLMFAAHIYKASTNVSWTYDEVYQVVSSLHSMANKWDVPMYLGEYGTRNYKQAGTATGYNDIARAYFSEIVHKACQVAGVVPIAWEQGDNKPNEEGVYSYWNRENCVPTFKTIQDAMIRGSYLPVSDKNLNYDFTDITEGVTVVPITKLDINSTDVTLNLEDTTTLTAVAEPADTNDVVLWSTDDDSVATVYRGMIHAKGIGTTTIHAYSQSGSVNKDITVTVKSINTEAPATEITTVKDIYNVTQGNNFVLDAALVPANSTDKLSFKSSNEKIITVNEMGKVLGIKNGTAYITITASSGITKTVKVVVISQYANPSVNLALNVLYSDSTHKYYGTETGTPINVTGDGQYTVTFDLTKDISEAGKKAGITEINKLTAIYIKDYDVTKGNIVSAPITAANIVYDKVVVNDKELTINIKDPKQVVSKGVLDSGGPVNGYDSKPVLAEVTSSSNVASFTGITAPTSISVTFTLQGVTWLTETPDKVNEATKIEATARQNLFIDKVGGTSEVSVGLTPVDTDSYVSFVSSDQSVVVIDNRAVACVDGNASAIMKAVGNGTAIITAMTENGLMKTFKVTVGPVTEEPGQSPSTPSTPTATPAPTATPTPTKTPGATPTPITAPTTINGQSVDLKINVSQNDNGSVAASIELPADDILKMASESDKPLQLSIPVAPKSVVDLAKQDDVKKVDLSVTLPDKLISSDNVDITNINLDTDLLKAAKAEGKDVSVKVNDENGKELYSWTFQGEELAASSKKVSDVNLSLSVSKTSDNLAVSKLLSKVSLEDKGIVIDFNHHGVLPAQASVRIYVGDISGIKPGSKAYVYYYNPDTKKLESIPYSSGYTVDKDGYIKINLVHCSDYVVLPKAASSKIVTTILDQVKVTVSDKTLTKKATSKIIVKLPSTLELISDLSKETSSDAIGAVTVSYSSSNKKVIKVSSKGVITAVGKGTAKVTTKIKLYSGKTKVITTTITVK